MNRADNMLQRLGYDKLNVGVSEAYSHRTQKSMPITLHANSRLHGVS